jgi:predicted P-loop ATPase
MADRNEYNPCKAYLEFVASRSTPCNYFDTLASTLIGTPEDIAQNPRMPDGKLLADVIMKRFMIGAVARVLQPGVRHDWMPIFIGGQNCGKSTFFQYLTPPDPADPGNYPWVSTIQQGIEYLKDRPHALHSGWIVVLDEAERYFKRKHVEELKNLVSVSVDRSARKYENEKNYPRSFVLAGATNGMDFLVDPTGNRRFMPIIVSGKVASKDNPKLKIIDLDRLKSDRNSIWAAAYQAYLDEPIHNFSSYELSHIADYIDSFTKDSPLETRISETLTRNMSGYYKTQGYITLSDLYSWLEIAVDKQAQIGMQVTDALKRLNYKQCRATIDGKTRRIWLRPN